MLRQILDEVPSLKAPGIIWRAVFNDDQYEKFSRTWLIPLSQRPRSHICGRCCGLHKIVFHSEDDIISVPPPDSHCERKILTPEEACIYEFNERKFIERLCLAFSIEQNIAAYGNSGLLRIGWIGGPLRQYPVFLLLRNPQDAANIGRNLLLEEESPFVFFTNTDLPHLYPLFKKKTCSLFALSRIAGLSASGLSAVLTGQELFAGFLRGLENTGYTPSLSVQILDDFGRILFPDGNAVVLKRAHKRRAVVRFIYEWVQQTGDPVFDQEVVREAYNKQHPESPWMGDRFREDLFKRNLNDFDRLFQTLDAANQRFRLKI
jgi:hypothetical protein